MPQAARRSSGGRGWLRKARAVKARTILPRCDFLRCRMTVPNTTSHEFRSRTPPSNVPEGPFESPDKWFLVPEYSPEKSSQRGLGGLARAAANRPPEWLSILNQTGSVCYRQNRTEASCQRGREPVAVSLCVSPIEPLQTCLADAKSIEPRIPHKGGLSFPYLNAWRIDDRDSPNPSAARGSYRSRH